MPHMILKNLNDDVITSYTDKDLRVGDTLVAWGKDESGDDYHVKLRVTDRRLIQAKKLKTGVDCDTVQIHFETITESQMEKLLRGGRWRKIAQ